VFTIRPGVDADAGFVAEMLAEAANWDPTRALRSLPEILAIAEFRHYVDGWPRPDDISMIAEATDGTRIGAAWCRCFAAADPGYGFIDETTPEVSIGVVEAWRGRGVGGALLDALAHAARRRDVAALSLSVEPGNRAMRLYERHGYVVVIDMGGARTMRLELGSREG